MEIFNFSNLILADNSDDEGVGVGLVTHGEVELVRRDREGGRLLGRVGLGGVHRDVTYAEADLENERSRSEVTPLDPTSVASHL